MPSTSFDEPQLVIDPQGHSDMVLDVMFTPDGTRLLSVSRDKTIRMWDVETGDLLKTIRGQIGHGPEGMLYAGDLSPDGKILAAGGFLDRFGGEDVGNIRLLNLETGEQIGRLKGHENIVTALAFSSDGNRLASGSGDHTIRIWKLPPLQPSPEGREPPLSFEEGPELRLEGHTARVQHIAFSPDGTRLVSASYDGTLRLWELPENLQGFGNLEGVKYTEMKEHTGEVRCVAYAPNGEYIVSGGYDRKILLWNRDGKFIKELDQPDGRISTIAFSADSKKIVAVKQQGIVAYVYSIPAGQKLTTFTKHTNTVPAAAFYGNNLIVTTGGDYNDMYIWEARSGTVKTHIVGKGRKVWAIAFGSHVNVAFGKSKTTEELIKEPLEKSLDFSEMYLNHLPPLERAFRRVQMTYQDQTLEKISTLQLQIRGGGTISNDTRHDRWIRAYSFTPDGDVVVGSDFSLKLYRNDGELLRQFVGHTGAVWAVSVSEDGRILASASNDQTIKLWNLNTGECLATLFVASDNEWVCWTPQGYYAASAGGEKYIGWHLNQGRDETAEYYPVLVFRKEFHHPKLVKRTIAVGNFEKALEQINAESSEAIRDKTITQLLPPRVQWILPQTHRSESSQPSIRIKAEVLSESHLTSLKVLVNGRVPPEFVERARAARRGLVLGDQQNTKEESTPDNIIDQEVTLTAGRNSIVIFAANENAGVTSEEYIVFYNVAEAEQLKPNLYMVSIGISTYQQSNLQLEYADNDAKAMSRLFRSQEGTLYNRVVIQELYDDNATRENILNALEWLQKETTQKDVAVFFIAAHGYNDDQGTFYLIPTAGNLENLRQTGVNWGDFSKVLGNLPSRVLLFLDTCHSGQLGENLTALRRQVDNTEAIRTLASDEYGVVILAASTGKEFSLEHPDWGHGAFTKALLEALEQGRADYSGDRVVNLRELDTYIAERVENLTNNGQHPTTQKPSTISRFPIVQVK